jgi:anti-anti-sigma factor
MTDLAARAHSPSAEFLDSCSDRVSGPDCVLRTESVVVTVSGRLDRLTAPKFRMRVVQLLMLPLESLTLDVHGVTFIDGAGVSVFAVAQREARARGVAFALASVPAKVREVMAREHADDFDLR